MATQEYCSAESSDGGTHFAGCASTTLVVIVPLLSRQREVLLAVEAGGGYRHEGGGGGGRGNWTPLSGHQEAMSQPGDHEAQESSTGHVLGVVFVVTHSGEGGEESKEDTANLYERLHQPEVPAAHPGLQVEDREGHAVDREGGVAGHKTEAGVTDPLLTHSLLHSLLSLAAKLCDVEGARAGATG